MKLLLVTLSVAIMAVAGAQFVPKPAYSVPAALAGTKDGGAIYTFFGTVYNYTIPLAASDVQTLAKVSEMIYYLHTTAEKNPTAKVPVDIAVSLPATGPVITWKIGALVGACSDRIYSFTLDQFRSALDVMRTLNQWYANQFLGQMNAYNG